MKVYASLSSFRRLPKAIVTIGTFDGVHVGHQQIIRRLGEIATREGGESVVLTFFPHPRMVLQAEDNPLQLISTLEERQELLAAAGVQHLIVQPFDREFSRISATEFVRDVLIRQIGLQTLVIGYDHHFGRNREGSFKDLEEMSLTYGYRLEEIPGQVIHEMAVSSTKIRQSLLAGDVQTAAELLGYPFTLTGTVVAGDRIGRTLGFPTANLQVAESYKLIPYNGIYAVRVTHAGRSYNGMLYIGTRPVVDGKRRVIEVNLFDFDQEIYGERVTVHLIDRLRDDKPVGTLEELKSLLEEDRRNATKRLS